MQTLSTQLSFNYVALQIMVKVAVLYNTAVQAAVKTVKLSVWSYWQGVHGRVNGRWTLLLYKLICYFILSCTHYIITMHVARLAEMGQGPLKYHFTLVTQLTVTALRFPVLPIIGYEAG